MIDNPSSIDICQGLKRQSAALFFLVNPGYQCLLHDPGTGALQARSQLIDLIRQIQGNVGGQYFCRGHEADLHQND